MKPFTPQLVYFEPDALHYPLGQELKEKFEQMGGIEIRYTTSHNQVRNLPGDNDFQKYRVAKSTLVVGIRKTLKFDTSKPSAEYAIHLRLAVWGGIVIIAIYKQRWAANLIFGPMLMSMRF